MAWISGARLRAFCALWISWTLSITSQSVPPSIQTYTVTMPLDHFSASDTRVFQNRYWMNDTFYQKGGPVFMYDNGEADVNPSSVAQVFNTSLSRFAAMELAQKYHGIALYWEHRFYGGSMPFTYDTTTGVALAGYDAYKYLNNEQALEDVVYFAKTFQPPGYDTSLSSNCTPWVWIGGSYPGIRAAIIRERNPDVFFASWASSAPVQTKIDGWEYYTPIIQNMPHNCSADVNAALTYADNILLHGSEAEVALLKQALYNTDGMNPRHGFNNSDSPSDLTFWELATIIGYPFQGSFFAFQSFGYAHSLGTFCDQLEKWNPSSFPGDDLEPNSSGIAATYNQTQAFYAYLFATINKSIQDYRMFPNNPRSPLSTASWTWQLCSQFTQWQVSNPKQPINLVSRFYNVSATEANYCHVMFPYAPPLPDIDAILKYGGWKMTPSNTMFTNGEIDPFRTLGVQAYKGINPMALDRKTTTVIPKCGQPPDGDEVFGIVYEGAVHGQDLQGSVESGSGTGTTPLDQGLELFGKALDQWLPCFKAKE